MAYITMEYPYVFMIHRDQAQGKWISYTTEIGGAAGGSDLQSREFPGTSSLALGGRHVFLMDSTDADPPRLTIIDLAMNQTKWQDVPLLGGAAGHDDWRVRAGNEQWVVFSTYAGESQFEPRESFWALALGDSGEAIPQPIHLELDSEEREEGGVFQSHIIKEDTLFYSVFEPRLPWSPKELRALELPSGDPHVLDGIRSGLGTLVVDDGRIVHSRYLEAPPEPLGPRDENPGVDSPAPLLAVAALTLVAAAWHRSRRAP